MTRPLDSADVVIVLAAGRGTRAGGPKALRSVGGQVWWRRQHESLSTLSSRALWVVSPEVQASLRRETGRPGAQIVAKPDEPMFASIVAGLAGAGRFRAAFILPVDVPAPAAATWEALALSDQLPSIPMFRGKRGHPVRLPWAWARREILPHISDTSWVARTRLDVLTAQRLEIEVPDSDVVVDLDTPEDFDRWAAGRGPH